VFISTQGCRELFREKFTSTQSLRTQCIFGTTGRVRTHELRSQYCQEHFLWKYTVNWNASFSVYVCILKPDDSKTNPWPDLGTFTNFTLFSRTGQTKFKGHTFPQYFAGHG